MPKKPRVVYVIENPTTGGSYEGWVAQRPNVIEMFIIWCIPIPNEGATL